MRDWQTKKLGDVAHCQDGDWILSENMVAGSEVRLIQLGDVGDGIFLDKTKKYISEAKCSELKCSLLQAGDILLARLGDPIGKSCIFPSLSYKAITAVDCTIIRADKKIVLQQFLLYTINSNYFRSQISKFSVGTTRKRISRKNLEKILVQVPPIDTQKQIVEKLDAIKKLQELNQKEIEKADEYFGTSLIKLLSPKDGWSTKKLYELVDMVNGRAFKPSEWKTSGLPIIRIQNLNNSNASFNYYDGKYENRYLVQDQDLLFSWSGNLGTSFGAFIWNRGDAVLNQHIFNVKLKDHDVTKSYLFFLLTSLVKNIEARTHGAIGLVHITKSELEKTIINYPDIQTQDQIVERLNETKLLQETLFLEKLKFTELFENTLHNLLSQNYEN